MVLSVIFIYSCNNSKDKNIYLFEKQGYNTKIEKFATKYYGYSVIPVLRGKEKIFVSLPDSTSFYINNFSSSNPKKITFLEYNFDKNHIPIDSLLIISQEILSEQSKLNIQATKTLYNCKAMVFHTKYVNNENDSLKKVFVFTKLDTLEMNCFFDFNNSIQKINNYWYTYSSNLYVGYDGP